MDDRLVNRRLSVRDRQGAVPFSSFVEQRLRRLRIHQSEEPYRSEAVPFRGCRRECGIRGSQDARVGGPDWSQGLDKPEHYQHNGVFRASFSLTEHIDQFGKKFGKNRRSNQGTDEIRAFYHHITNGHCAGIDAKRSGKSYKET